MTVYEYDVYNRLSKKLYFSSESAWDNGNGVSGHTVATTYERPMAPVSAHLWGLAIAAGTPPAEAVDHLVDAAREAAAS